jgi:hypothetical protein
VKQSELGRVTSSPASSGLRRRGWSSEVVVAEEIRPTGRPTAKEGRNG